MSLSAINNGDTGLSARTKINAAFEAIDAKGAMPNDAQLLYVDSVNGSDATGDGTAAKPFASAQQARTYSLAHGSNHVFALMPNHSSYPISLPGGASCKFFTPAPGLTTLAATITSDGTVTLTDVANESVLVTLSRATGLSTVRFDVYQCKVTGASLNGSTGANGTKGTLGDQGAMGDTDQDGQPGGTGGVGNGGGAGTSGGFIYAYQGTITGSISLLGGNGGNGGDGGDGGQGGQGGMIDISVGTNGGAGGDGGLGSTGGPGGGAGGLFCFDTRIIAAAIAADTGAGGAGGEGGQPGSGGGGQGGGLPGSPGNLGDSGVPGDPGSTFGAHEFTRCFDHQSVFTGTYTVTHYGCVNRGVTFGGGASITDYGTLNDTAFTA